VFFLEVDISQVDIPGDVNLGEVILEEVIPGDDISICKTQNLWLN